MRSFTSIGGTAGDMGNIAVNMVITKKAMPDKDKHPGHVSMYGKVRRPTVGLYRGSFQKPH